MVWSGCSGGWDDHESKINCLLDNDHTRSRSYRKWRRGAVCTILGQPSWHGARPWLPVVLLCHPGILEGLGAIAILVPRFPRLKEWAYAGIFFDLTGAAASCVAVGGYGV